MTSANKKLGYYDFKHSYQYPMSNATPMDITRDQETKGQKEAGAPKTSVQEAQVRSEKEYIPPHLCKRKTPVQGQKYHFSEDQKDRKESGGNPYSL